MPFADIEHVDPRSAPRGTPNVEELATDSVDTDLVLKPDGLGGVVWGAGGGAGVTDPLEIGAVELTDYLSVGAAPAQTGSMRLTLGEAISWRNPTDDGDIIGLALYEDADVEHYAELGGGYVSEIRFNTVNYDDDGEPIFVVSGYNNKVGIFSGNDLVLYDASFAQVRTNTQEPGQQHLTIGSDIVQLSGGNADSGSPVQPSGYLGFNAAFFSEPFNQEIPYPVELRATRQNEIDASLVIGMVGGGSVPAVRRNLFITEALSVYPGTGAGGVNYSGMLGKSDARWAALYSGALHVPSAAAGVAASQTLTISSHLNGSGLNSRLDIGNKRYTFVPDVDFNADGEIADGADLAAQQANIVAAINGTDGINAPNDYVTCSAFVANVATITALEVGLAGNSVWSRGSGLVTGFGAEFLAGGLEPRGVFVVGLPTADPANGLSQLWQDNAAGRVLKVGT